MTTDAPSSERGRAEKMTSVDARSSEKSRSEKLATRLGHGHSTVPAAPTSAEYERLVSSSMDLINTPPLDFLGAKEKKLFLEKNLKKAESQCRRALELSDMLPAAHYALGCAQSASGAMTAASASFIAAADRSDRFSSEWANAAARAYAMLVDSPDAERPEWWTDEQLMEFSERAVNLLPSSGHTHRWRAGVLCGLPLGLPTLSAARSAEQMRIASTHYQNAAKFAESKEDKRPDVEAAAACLVLAKRLDAQATASSTAGGVGDEEEEKATTSTASSKNAAKNRRKKEKAKQKLADQLMSELEAGPETNAAASEAAASSADAELPIAPPSTPSAASSASKSVYRWADPLPDSFLDTLAEMGINAGDPVTDIDMVGIDAEGGADEAIRVGLIVLA